MSANGCETARNHVVTVLLGVLDFLPACLEIKFLVRRALLVVAGKTVFLFGRHESNLGGIRFADYHNFVFESEHFDVAAYDSLYQYAPDRLEQISDVLLEGVDVHHRKEGG